MRSGWVGLALLVAGCGGGEAERAVIAALPDGRHASFQKMEERSSHVCGEVNAGDRTDPGYRRFVYSQAADTAVIDPGPPPLGSARPASDPVCTRPLSYQSVTDRIECQQGAGLESAWNRKRAFESMWQRQCAAGNLAGR